MRRSAAAVAGPRAGTGISLLSGGRFFGPAGNACFTKGFEAFWGTVFLAHVTRNGPSKVSPFHLISESRSIDHNGRETDDFPLAEALFSLVL